MYLAIDIGGTKTLVATFSDSGELLESSKFSTPEEYSKFLKTLEQHLSNLSMDRLKGVGVGVPGVVNTSNGNVRALGNLPWKNIPIAEDISNLVGVSRVSINNDAKLAALSEARLLDNAKCVLYITISTGIGVGVVYDGELDPALAACEGGRMLYEHEGKVQKWEHFASGKAINKKYGKIAAEIPAGSPEWKEISRNLALGLYNLIALIQPDKVVIGGGVGSHLDRYHNLLVVELNKLSDHSNMVVIPTLVGAKRPEEAVIYGCYELARQADEKAN